jgi:hypothetical protein
MCRPRLKRRRIARHRREIAIVQPVQNLLFLAHARVALAVFPVLPCAVSERSFRSVFVAFVVIRFFPATTDEEHVAGLDVAALSSRANVDALVLTALVQLLPGNRVVVIRVVVDAFLVRVASVVEEDSSSRDTMLGPVVDRTFVVSCWAYDVAAFGL